MQRIRVIKSPFALVVLLLILGPVAELWPYWVSFLYLDFIHFTWRNR
jgi:hypothetical protein